MNLYRSLEDIPRNSNHVITAGIFDGVHRGHRFIINQLLEVARECGGIPSVVTFDPHPQHVLTRNGTPPLKLLTTVEEKAALLDRLGVENLFVLPFDEEFSRLSADDYVEHILIGRIGFKCILIGYDHAFGRDRQGGVHTLEKFADRENFKVLKLEPQRNEDQIISSTLIRTRLEAGQVAEANQLLERPYGVRGTVVPGDKRGRSLGFPTANIEPESRLKALPGRGVYAATISLGGECYQGMANIGIRPTFGGKIETLEIHIFSFSGEIYGQSVEIHFYDKLRDEQRFTSVDALISQLNQDQKQAIDYFLKYQNQVNTGDVKCL